MWLVGLFRPVAVFTDELYGTWNTSIRNSNACSRTCDGGRREYRFPVSGGCLVFE